MWNIHPPLRGFGVKAGAASLLLILGTSCNLPAPLGECASEGTVQVGPAGYFDIGAGYGVVGGGGPDVAGYVFSVKAYPFGRWYSNTLSVSESAKNNITRTLRDREEKEAAELKKNSGSPGALAASKAKGNEEAIKQIQSDVATWDMTEAWGSNAVPMECAKTYQRFSVFYGRSLGSLSGNGTEGTYNCVGIGWDIAPEFAVQIGYGTLNLSESEELDHRLFWGISLNLNAFKSLISDGSM